MEEIIIDGQSYMIESKPIHIGDRVYDKNSGIIYKASIMDADDIGWVVCN